MAWQTARSLGRNTSQVGRLKLLKCHRFGRSCPVFCVVGLHWAVTNEASQEDGIGVHFPTTRVPNKMVSLSATLSIGG